MSKNGMDKIEIHVYQAKTIENALRLAMNALDSRNKATETALDRELMLADKFIKSVIDQITV